MTNAFPEKEQFISDLENAAVPAEIKSQAIALANRIDLEDFRAKVGTDNTLNNVSYIFSRIIEAALMGDAAVTVMGKREAGATEILEKITI